MRKISKVGYELCDINVIQSAYSEIGSRTECNTKIEMCGREAYPVVVAPMAAVTNENNYKVWLDNGFICVVPRTVAFEKRLEISRETFCSFSLDESESLLGEAYHSMFSNDVFYVCVDIAQGTMKRMYDVCSRLKRAYRGVVVMAGNVANPEAYKYYAEAGIDYMRLSIGSGSRCVVEGTNITMADNTNEPIETLDIGDVVNTLNGPKKITNVFAKQVKKTVKINNEIETTLDHKFLVVKKSDIIDIEDENEILKKAFYLEAERVNKDYWLVKA